MSGESVLVVDDKSVSLRLTRILLVNEGYRAITASSTEEALDLLQTFHPDLALVDLQLRGTDGFELTRRLKQDERTRGIPVLALTAQRGSRDEQRAAEAGCDGSISRPVEARALGARIREMLNGRLSPAAVANRALSEEINALRARFLAEGREKSNELLLQMDGKFDVAEASRPVHQWSGTAGLFGYTAIGRLARETEALLQEKPLDNSLLRESLTKLALAFSASREAREAPLPERIVRALQGKTIAAVAFPANEIKRISSTLARVNAEAVFIPAGGDANGDGANACDLTLAYVTRDGATTAWLRKTATSKPLVLVGSRDALLDLGQPIQSAAREFLMDAWEPEEALVRLSLALAYRPETASADGAAERARPQHSLASGRNSVVIADDDPTVLALVGAALENSGMDCHLAADGASALKKIRRIRPQAAVLDVNMPQMDGHELLATIRREELPMRVLLLTARQQESDVLRGFALGADDYVVKPFSPMELAVRLKRLFMR